MLGTPCNMIYKQKVVITKHLLDRLIEVDNNAFQEKEI
jgi:hypothetical protein